MYILSQWKIPWGSAIGKMAQLYKRTTHDKGKWKPAGVWGSVMLLENANLLTIPIQVLVACVWKYCTLMWIRPQCGYCTGDWNINGKDNPMKPLDFYFDLKNASYLCLFTTVSTAFSTVLVPQEEMTGTSGETSRCKCESLSSIHQCTHKDNWDCSVHLWYQHWVCKGRDRQHRDRQISKIQ